MTFDNLNLKGTYRATDSNGVIITYQKNDVVLYKGKTYIANRTITETSPAHGERGGWSLVSGGSNPIQFYWGEKVPLQVNIGDEWFDTTTGKLFKYVTDGNSEQWVNIY